MAIPTPQYVRDLSLTGEFNTITDDQINYVITDEVLYMYESAVFAAADMHTRVVGLHTAHILKVALMLEGGGNQQVGQLVSAKVGPLEKKWGLAQQAVAPGDGLDETTQYGRRCVRLLRSYLPSVMTSAL